MSDESLQRVLAFNEELTALSATGLPLDLGFSDDRPLDQTLANVSSSMALQVGRGKSVDQLIAGEQDLPPRYRAALATWARCEDSTAVIESIVSRAATQYEFRSSVGRTLIQPLIIVALAYLGFVYLCLMVAPKIESIYAQLWQTPSNSLALLTAGRMSITIWGPLVPLILFAAVLLWRRRSSQFNWRWLPGSSRYFDARRNAQFADQMATLLENEFSLNEALALAGPMSGVETTGSLHEETEQATLVNRLAADDPIVLSLPPMLRWALSGDLDGEPMPSILRFAAKTYRGKAERQATVLRALTPAICGALLGGLIVMGYGLCLFLPVIEVLKTLSLPAGV